MKVRAAKTIPTALKVLVAVFAVVAVALVWSPRGPVRGQGVNSISSPDTSGDVGQDTSLAIDDNGDIVVSYYDVTNADLKLIRCGNHACSAGNSITSPDTSGSVGPNSSLALDSTGNPVVSYLDQTNVDLKLLHCGNEDCTAGNSITSPDTAGFVGVQTSLALDSSGYPVVSYYDSGNGDLKVLHCDDADCSGGGESVTSPDTSGDVGRWSSLAIDATGNPVVSYWDTTNDDLKVLHCGNANCTAGNSITSPDTAGSVGSYTSIALDASGNPVISYWDFSNQDLKVLHCGNADCTSGNSITSPDTGAAVGSWISLVLDAAGNPVVSYYDGGSNDDLRLLHCGDADCTSGNSIVSPDTAGNVGVRTSLALDAAGNPVVSYYDLTNLDLKVLHCASAGCRQPFKSIASPDTSGDVGQYTSLALDASGNPVVSYYDVTSADLKVLHCGDADCTAGNTVTSADTTGGVGQYSSLALDASGYPVVSYFDGGVNVDLKLLHCGNSNCTSGNSINSPLTSGDVGDDTSLELDGSGNPVISFQGDSSLIVMHCNDANCTGGDESINFAVDGAGLNTSLELDASGNPVISYRYFASDDLSIAHCGNVNCTSGNSITSPDTTGTVGLYTSLALDASGYPVVSYYDATNDDLKILHCGNANCTAANSVTSPDTSGNVGWYTSLALDASGYPVVSYYDATNGDLKVLHCDDANCSGGGESITSPDTTGDVGQYTSLALDSFGNPVMSYYDVTNGDLKVLHCGNADCAALAVSFIVDSTSDVVDASPGNGVCDDGGGNCTLRAAIQEANALAGEDVVVLPAGTYTLTIAGTLEDAAATGDLDITDDVSLKGVSPDSTIIDGGGIDRVFHVIGSSSLTLASLAVTGGDPSGSVGGGIFVEGGGGTLNASAVAIDGNTATGGAAITVAGGSTLQISASTISNNSATANGGGIAIVGSSATITNTTISGNEADNDGGGVYFSSGAPSLNLNNVTIGENIADADSSGFGQGGGIASVGSQNPLFANSIVARNINTLGGAPDCDGTVDSDGYNLIGDDSGCTFNSTTGDQVGTGGSPIDPLYGRLRNNGGLTETHAISVTSPAIDAGDPGASCETVDQRGEVRPLDGDSDTVARCDIGAYERQGAIDEPCDAPAGGLCEIYRFDTSLTVTAFPPCSADGDLATERDPTGDADTDSLDDAHLDIIYADGYVDCPGDFFIGSSIPSEGTIEEQQNNQPGILEFPALGHFTLCLTIASHPFGDLHNCPDDFPVMSKSPLEFTCKIYSLADFICDIDGTSIFYDDSGTAMATVTDGSAELDWFESQGGGKLTYPGDTDGDGCPDQNENLGDETMGGLRDYTNPWDYYDVLGAGASLTHDGTIDLPNDILGVIQHYAPTGASPYDVRFDRGPQVGAYTWNLGPPDGVIDLPNDILGVILQFQHNCL